VRRVSVQANEPKNPDEFFVSLPMSYGDSMLDVNPYFHIYGLMKTTIDLPDDILERTKIAAAKRRTSIKNLVIEGLERVLREEPSADPPAAALARLQ
jgi:hypothetical protein